MDLALNQFSIEIPNADLSFFKSLVKKMGWKAKSTSKTRKVTTSSPVKKYKIDSIQGILSTDYSNEELVDEYIDEKYKL